MPLSLTFCVSARDSVEVNVANTSGEVLGPRTIELPAAELLGRLGSIGVRVENAEGTEIPMQLTHDSLLIFMAEVAPGEEQVYKLYPQETPVQYQPTVWGQEYPKRRDDISYENELVGFRIYGPGTQQAGEKAFGYDIFFKHPTDELIVPQLYAPETDDAVWAKVDSLRQVDPKLADEFIGTFSYHIDHGLGMDCYAVGPTLGAGVAALASEESIWYPWCYEKAEILDNGPLRFTLALEFPESVVNGDTIREHRLITLDSQSHLNKTKVRYEGLGSACDVVAGFPLRDETAPITDGTKGILAYSDPTQGPENGRALLGITMKDGCDVAERDGHILAVRRIAPEESFDYCWGFAWDCADINSLEEWAAYLLSSKKNYEVRIK